MQDPFAENYDSEEVWRGNGLLWGGCWQRNWRWGTMTLLTQWHDNWVLNDKSAFTRQRCSMCSGCAGQREHCEQRQGARRCHCSPQELEYAGSPGKQSKVARNKALKMGRAWVWGSCQRIQFIPQAIQNHQMVVAVSASRSLSLGGDLLLPSRPWWGLSSSVGTGWQGLCPLYLAHPHLPEPEHTQWTLMKE